MKKYAWVKWADILWARDEYVVGFKFETMSSRPLPKRRLINNLKVLMTCPVGFRDEALGLRQTEHTFIIYDYNIKRGEGI